MKKSFKIFFFPCGTTGRDALARSQDLKKFEKLQKWKIKQFSNTKNRRCSSENQWTKNLPILDSFVQKSPICLSLPALLAFATICYNGNVFHNWHISDNCHYFHFLMKKILVDFKNSSFLSKNGRFFMILWSRPNDNGNYCDFCKKWSPKKSCVGFVWDLCGISSY